MTWIEDPDLATYCGRIGNLYAKYRMSPPFGLYHAAQGWIARDIPLWHCLDVIGRFLSRHAGSCYSGSGDWNFAWLNCLIQTTWHDRSFAMPHRSSPKDTCRRDWPDEYTGEELNQRADLRTPLTARHPNRNSKPDSFEPHPPGLREKAARAFSPARDTKSAFPQQVPKHHCSASTLSRQTLASSPKKIDEAVAWLRAELASGERPAVEVESNALCASIAPRTYDRARKRLGVISRRIGFGRCAKYMIALPGVVHGTPSEGRTRRAFHERAERVTETKERDMARDADAPLAASLSAHGVKKKRSAQRRPRGEVQKVLAKIRVSGKEAPNLQDVLQTIEQIMARAVRSK